MDYILLKRKGQATLELSLIVGILFLLLLGVVRIAGWFNSDMANRQVAYKQSRVEAGQGLDTSVPYQTPRLNIFGEAER